MLLCVLRHEFKVSWLLQEEIIPKDIANVYPFPDINNEEELR